MPDKSSAGPGKRRLAIDADVVAFVRLGFGDSHRLSMRSLNFEVAVPNRATLESALIDGVVGYNSMSGKVAANVLCPLWDGLSDTYLGRNSDPYLRLWLPHTRQQRNGGDDALAIALSATETADLIKQVKEAAKACAATALIRGIGHTATWSREVPAHPAEMLLLWQD
jgi:hypothetical protein